jgi:hypothetical protein
MSPPINRSSWVGVGGSIASPYRQKKLSDQVSQRVNPRELPTPKGDSLKPMRFSRHDGTKLCMLEDSVSSSVNRSSWTGADGRLAHSYKPPHGKT